MFNEYKRYVICKRMTLSDILSVGLSTIIMLIITHIAVFYVVRTLYPPVVRVAAAATPIQVSPPVVLSQPSVTEQQTVNVPTYEIPLPNKVSSEEGVSDISSLIAGAPN